MFFDVSGRNGRRRMGGLSWTRMSLSRARGLYILWGRGGGGDGDFMNVQSL